MFGAALTWLVVFNVDVHVLQFSDLLAVTIDQCLPVPFGDVPMVSLLLLGHRQASSVWPA
jgi:hypothetical protein